MNKAQVIKSIRIFIPSFLCALILLLSGCMSTPSPQMSDSRNYVRQHKGEGTRASLLGSEAELMDSAVNSFADSGTYSVTREPHAVFATYSTGLYNLSYAIYFSPSPVAGFTDVEVLMACRLFSAEQIQKFEQDQLISGFPFSYLNTKLLEPEYDPNTKDGPMLALTTAAFYDYRSTAIKLINRGADIDAATSELKEMASRNIPYLSTPANKKTYDRANAGVAMLSKLKKSTRQSRADSESDAIFQKAVRTNISIADQKQQMESARKFKVQAEDAVHENKFDEAIDLYKQALDIAPLWPEGHFNRALLLGNRGDYEIAIREMKRYLLLVPNAANANAAQNKIYSWERKAGIEQN